MSNGAELKTKSSIAHEPHSIDHLTKGILHFIKQDDSLPFINFYLITRSLREYFDEDPSNNTDNVLQ